MADDTVTSVVGRIAMIAPQITGLDADTMRTFADDAVSDATSDGFTGSMLERAAGYLAAHYAYVAFNQNSSVKKEQAAVLSREYFDRNGSDAYLAEYQRLLAALNAEDGGSSIARFL